MAKSDLKSRVERVEKGLEKLLIDNNLVATASFTFPIYNEYPAEVKLALIVLKKHECKLGIEYEDVSKKKP